MTTPTTPTVRLLDLQSQYRHANALRIGTAYLKPVRLVTLPKFPSDDYDDFDILGVGGFGEVYTASSSDGTVAIKRIREADETFPPEREVEALLRIRAAAEGACTRSVICLIDAFYSPRMPLMKVSRDEIVQPFIVTEFVKGRTLATKITAPDSRFARWFLEGIETLRFLHERAGVVHRDVRGPNMLIRDSDQSLVIIDVGAACFVENLAECSAEASLSVGDPDYGSYQRHVAFGGEVVMGREEWFGDDVWGLAMTILNAVSGQIPFIADRRGVLSWFSIQSALEATERDLRPVERFNERLQTLLPTNKELAAAIALVLQLEVEGRTLKAPPTTGEFRTVMLVR